MKTDPSADTRPEHQHRDDQDPVLVVPLARYDLSEPQRKENQIPPAMVEMSGRVPALRTETQDRGNDHTGNSS